MAPKQQMSLSAPPRGSLPEWGRRIGFERFFAELVPAGERRFNVRLSDSLATISFGADQGTSSLAGDRMRRYERRPYEFIVVPPGFPLRGESAAAPEVLVLVFRFDALKAEIAAALQIDQDILEPRVIIGAANPFARQIAQHVRRQLLAETPSADYLESLCLAMIVEMLRLPPRQQATRRGTTLGDRVLQSILGYIDANLDSNLSLETLAGLAGVRTHQFGRAFKRKTGAPPHQYVLARRLEAARALLLETEDSLAAIAYATGFSSQSHMTTTFRREIGITPAKLRDRADSPGDPPEA